MGELVLKYDSCHWQEAGRGIGSASTKRRHEPSRVSGSDRLVLPLRFLHTLDSGGPRTRGDLANPDA